MQRVLCKRKWHFGLRKKVIKYLVEITKALCSWRIKWYETGISNQQTFCFNTTSNKSKLLFQERCPYHHLHRHTLKSRTENSPTIRHCETGKPFHLGGSRKAGEEFQGIAIAPPGIPAHTALKRCLPEKPCLSGANASSTALLSHSVFWTTKPP